jgi:ParB family chromosome partitioning protein
MLEDKITKFSGKVYYYLNESYGTVSFYKERPKAPVKRRPQAEIDRDKYISDTRGRLQELTELAYELRKQFVDNLTFTSKNAEKIYKGAMISIALHAGMYISNDSFGLYKLLGLNTEGWDSQRAEKAVIEMSKCSPSIYPKVVYHHLGDKKDLKYFDGSVKCFPTHWHDYHLDAIYEWLVSLGYEMSDDERKLQDGTHELFIDKGNAGKGE